MMYGSEVLHKPTHLFAPPQFNVFSVHKVTTKAKFHMFYLTALQWAAILFVSTSGVYDPYHSDRANAIPHANHLAWLSLASQGSSAEDAVMMWCIVWMLNVVFYTITLTSMFLWSTSVLLFGPGKMCCFWMTMPVWSLIMIPFALFERILSLILSPVLHCLGYEPVAWMRQGARAFYVSNAISLVLNGTSKDWCKDVRKLTADIQEVAIKRLKLEVSMAASVGLDGVQIPLKFVEDPGQMSESLVFPNNIEPVAFIDWKCKVVPTPGKLLTDLALFLADVFTDTYSWSVFLRHGHVLFAGCLAAVAWASTLIQLKTGMIAGLIRHVMESKKAGVPTIQWINLLDTEKGLESMVSFIVQGYGFFFSGLTCTWDLFVNQLSIVISLLAIATYLQDNCDLKQADAGSEATDAPAAFVLLTEFLELSVVVFAPIVFCVALNALEL
mmetsp:Transcript_142473/g.454617  ORF Transcript_142473/g.454617 Transcript_142473/m.454617 type:complete len:441 (-) Transcript_142473:46-1368(-)